MIRFPGVLGVVLLLMLTAAASAQYRADFFDNTRKPTVTFNQKTLTWTLKNQAVERVIRFDAKAGSLMTAACRNLKNRHELRPAPNGEGAISFVAPLLEPPTPLRGWRMTTAITPPTNWLKADFDDAAWNTPTPNAQLPTPNAPAATAYLRCVVPADRMKPDHAYAILFDRAFPLYSQAEIFLDGELVQTLKREDRAWGRTIQIDASAKNRVIGIKLTAPKDALTLNGITAIAEEGTAPASLDLSSDWSYRYHAVNVTPSNSQVLSIALSGINKYERFDLTVHYEILPGDEPFVVKWFSFVSHRPTRFLIEQAVCDRWQLKDRGQGTGDRTPNAPMTYSFAAFNAATIETDGATGHGFLTAALSPLGATTHNGDGTSVATEIRSYTLVKPDVPIHLPKTLTGLFSGGIASGIFLHQWYVGAYQSELTPESFPIAYTTTYPFGTQISAAICSKLIPLASEIGAKLFVVGDGWQTNAMPNSGRRGDWITDRAPAKFPNGLMPISLEARMQRMRFGLWTDPVEVDDGSKALLDHPEWRLQTIEGVNTRQMCFTSGWQDLFSSSMQILCRELTITYLELDRDMLFDGCIDPAHLHPVAHSMEQQMAHRDIFHDKMGKVAPNFLVSGTDELRRAEWLPPFSSEQENGAYWLTRADQARRRLQTLLMTRPSFAIIGTVPAHLPTKQENLPALEYYYASVVGMTGNLEWQGDLTEMTAGEKALAQKWSAWAEANRDWLAYAQPLALVGMEASSAEGILHLRNAYKGKHGFACLFNPTDAPITIEPGFRPADFALKMNPNALTMTRMSGEEAGFVFRNGIVQLKPMTLAPHGWEIIEIKTK